MHNQRCKNCKARIKTLLEKIYGKVIENHKFEVGARIEDYSKIKHYSVLKSVYKSLQNHRGFEQFVRSKNLPRCDFFIPSKNFILEFDESQHFTIPRKIALKTYTDDIKLGFDKNVWINLCEKIKARDNDPPFRDEQRAWYDTVRDFLPEIKNLKPTVRLLSKDCVWCGLNPNNSKDVNTFKSFLEGKKNIILDSKKFKIEIKSDVDPFLGRIIIADAWSGDLKDAKKLLENICKIWPSDTKVSFIMTCGGFIQFAWPENLTKKGIGDNIYPNAEALNILFKKAEEQIKLLLDDNLKKKLRKFTDFLTFGIDSYKEKISTSQTYIGQLHVELVFLIDLKQDKIYWFGKSYPTPGQQKGLVRIVKCNPWAESSTDLISN